MSAFVKDESAQSTTVLVADCGEHSVQISNYLSEHGFNPGEGYGEKKKSQLRFANFPAHSKEQYERMVDLIEKLG